MPLIELVLCNRRVPTTLHVGVVRQDNRKMPGRSAGPTITDGGGFEEQVIHIACVQCHDMVYIFDNYIFVFGGELFKEAVAEL